jgi:hypothetical protein
MNDASWPDQYESVHVLQRARPQPERYECAALGLDMPRNLFAAA